MEALNVYDYLNLKEKLQKEKKPLFIKSKEVKIALVLTNEAKIYYSKRGFLSLTLEELFDVLLLEDDAEKQKELVQTILSVSNLFEAKKINVRRW